MRDWKVPDGESVSGVGGRKQARGRQAHPSRTAVVMARGGRVHLRRVDPSITNETAVSTFQVRCVAMHVRSARIFHVLPDPVHGCRRGQSHMRRRSYGVGLAEGLR